MVKKLTAADAHGSAKLSTLWGKRSRTEPEHDLSRAAKQAVLEAPNALAAKDALMDARGVATLPLPDLLDTLPLLDLDTLDPHEHEVAVPAICVPCEDEVQGARAPAANRQAGPVRRNQGSVVNGVKLRCGTEPTWERKGNGHFVTNVAYVCWDKKSKKWQVEKVNDAGKQVYDRLCATFAEAVKARRGVKDGVKGPGELAVADDGTVHLTKCSNCCRPFPLGHFAPVPCLLNLQRLPRFEAATAALASADQTERNAAWEALSVVPAKVAGCKALRTAWCYACRESMHKSAIEGDSNEAKCYAAKLEIRADMAKRGCQHLGCTEHRPECFEGDHEGRVGKVCAQYMCTNYMWFAWKYGENGPSEMWKCYKGTQPLCKNHHVMQDSHAAARGVDSEEMKDGKAKRKRKNHEECGGYNNGRKIGKQCKYCKMEFTADNARMGAWTHPADGTGKTTSVSNLVHSGTSFKVMKPRIDHVIDKECNGEIACHNCHYAEETYPMFTRQMERYRTLVETVHTFGPPPRAPLSDNMDDLLAPSDDD